MDNQLFRLYHLMNIDNCRKILAEGKIRSRNQHNSISAAAGAGKLVPDNFVHFNFCPKAPILWNLHQIIERETHLSSIWQYGFYSAKMVLLI